MKRLLRALKSHFGVTAPHVAVHTEIEWYWRALGIVALIGIGYGIGYWRYAGTNANLLAEEVQRLQSVNQSIQAKVVFAERQMQVEHAAQTNLAKEMAALQDEDMRLKEDVAFYKSILVEGAGVGIPKIHSMKVAKGNRAGDYQYNILLVQTGKRDKMVQGSLQLVLNGMQAGTPVALTVSEGQAPLKGVKVSFKYYQRIEGTFSIPSQLSAQALQARFFEQGSVQPKLTQSVNLPG